MKTNAEKYNYYLSIIQDRHKKFIESEVKDLPSSVYLVYPSGVIRERIIHALQVKYYDSTCQDIYRVSKKITKIDVANIKAHIELNSPLSVDNIRFYYEEIGGYGKSLSGMSYPEIMACKTKEECELMAADIIKKKEAEAELLRNGHTRCERCGAVTPNDKIVRQKMISYATYGREGRIMSFCGKLCAHHEQCSLEG
jgi:hypothetical protein